MKAVRRSLAVLALLVIGCSKSDFPTSPSPTLQTPLTTVQALKMTGEGTVPDGTVTPINMTLVARSIDATAPGRQAQTPGTTELSGNFQLGTGVKGSVSGSIEGSLGNGTFVGSLTADGASCSRQYTGRVSSAGIAWIASDNSGSCPVPISIQTLEVVGGTSCSFDVSELNTISGAGTTATISVTTGPTCTWIVQSLVPWLRTTDTPAFIGSGSVTLIADPNTEEARQGSLRIAGQLLTIDQGPPCTFEVSPTRVSFGSTAGDTPLTISAPVACEWRIENLPDWISASESSGSGTATVTLTAEPNSGDQREASFQAAGENISAIQSAGSCSLSIEPTSQAFSASGGAGSVAITASASRCTWTAQADVPWIVISGATSGSGNGSLAFTVAPNTGDARTGRILIDGQTVTITQQQSSLAPVTITLISPGVERCVSPTDDDSFCTSTDFGGGTVVADPAVLDGVCTIAESSVPIQSPADEQRTLQCTGQFPVGVPVTLTATPGANSDFAGWVGPCQGTGPCTVTVTGAGQAIGATFTAEPRLTVLNESPTVTVTSEPGGIKCTSIGPGCSLQVDSGTEIVLTSTNPNTFWNGCDSPANGQTPSGTCRVIMTADRTVRVRLTQFSGTAFQANVQTFSTGSLLRAAAARTKQNNEK